MPFPRGVARNVSCADLQLLPRLSRRGARKGVGALASAEIRSWAKSSMAQSYPGSLYISRGYPHARSGDSKKRDGKCAVLDRKHALSLFVRATLWSQAEIAAAFVITHIVHPGNRKPPLERCRSAVGKYRAPSFAVLHSCPRVDLSPIC